MSYQAHEFSEIIPFVINDIVYEMRDSIKDIGQMVPATTFEGKLLDGRLRQWCCEQLGIPLKTEPFIGTREEALAFVVSRNVARTHYTPEERAIVGAKTAALRRGDNEYKNTV